MNHLGMKYSLASREIIADSVEIMAMAHPFDAMVLIPNCDKVTPGMLMAMLRVNIPAIMVSGGPMLTGRFRGKDVHLVSVFEGVGRVKVGTMSEEELDELEDHACPGCGSCAGMFTANSMNCLTEAIGLGLPGNGTIPAVAAARIRLAKEAGMAVMHLLAEDIRPRDIATRAAFENAIAIDMALGCSTNTVLHVLAIAADPEAKSTLSFSFTVILPRSSEISTWPLLICCWSAWASRSRWALLTASEVALASAAAFSSSTALSLAELAARFPSSSPMRAS